MAEGRKEMDIDQWLSLELEKNALEEEAQKKAEKSEPGTKYEDYLGVMETFDDQLMNNYSGKKSVQGKTDFSKETVKEPENEKTFVSERSGSPGRSARNARTGIRTKNQTSPGAPGVRAAEEAARKSMTRAETLTTTGLRERAPESKITKAGDLDDIMEEIRRKREKDDKVVTMMIESQSRRSAPVLDDEEGSKTEKLIGNAVDKVEAVSHETIKKSRGKLASLFRKIKDKVVEHPEEEAQEKASEKASEKAPEKKKGEVLLEKTPEKVPEKVPEKTPEKAVEKDSEKTPDKAQGKTQEKSFEKTTEKSEPVKTASDRPSESSEPYAGKHGAKTEKSEPAEQKAAEEARAVIRKASEASDKLDPEEKKDALFQLRAQAAALARSNAEAEARLREKESAVDGSKAGNQKRSSVTMQLDDLFGDKSGEDRNLAEELRKAVDAAAVEEHEKVDSRSVEAMKNRYGARGPVPVPEASAAQMAAAAEREIADKKRMDNFMEVKPPRFGKDPRTVRNALKYGRQELTFIENGRHDATEIFRYVFGFSDKDIILRKDELLDDKAVSEYEKMIEKRLHGVPLQYIIGVQEFMGLPFRVNKNVLIPRQDTEVLVEQLLGVIKGEELRNPEILDMCTGSGAIGVSLAYELSDAAVTMADISPDAVNVAMHNARLNGVFQRCTFATGDLFESVPDWKKYDVIVCNPPYIRTDVIETLDPEVKDHEPRKALDGGKDGLDVYRRIAKESGRHLKPHGILALEIGYDQAVDVVTLLGEGGDFDGARIIKDLDNKDRVIITKKNK